MKMTATLRAPTFDRARYLAALTEHLSDALAHAAFEWIGAAIAEIPVWSGASHATFLPLARQLGFDLAISEKSKAPRRVSLGLRNSNGDFKVEPEKGLFTFTYETKLRHLIYNEFNNANVTPDPGLFSRLLDPGPYHFQAIAREAFLRSVSSVGLPDPAKFVKAKTVVRVR